MHATLQSTHSYVARESGSLFIKPLLEELKKHATSKHLLEILTTVTAKVQGNHPPIFFPFNSPGYDMKVKYKEKERSLIMVGKSGDIENIPLAAGVGVKTSVSHNVRHYFFTGDVINRKSKRRQYFKDTNAAVLLNYNQTDHEINGEIRSKVNQQSKRHGSVVIENNEPKVDNEVVLHTKDDTKFEILANVEGCGENIKPEILQGTEVACSIRHEKFTLTEKNHQWGIESSVAQLPTMTSTLLKKLYIVKVGFYKYNFAVYCNFLA